MPWLQRYEVPGLHCMGVSGNVVRVCRELQIFYLPRLEILNLSEYPYIISIP